MNLIERVKNILITPKTEWEVVRTETATPGSVLAGFVLPMSIFACLGTLISGFLFTGFFSFTYTIALTVMVVVVQVITYFLAVMIIDALSTSFGSEKNAGKTAQLVAYSSTPSYLAGFLSFIPFLGFLLQFVAWAYGVYLMYLGLGPLKKTPEDKKVVYIIVAYVIIIAIYFIISAILTAIIIHSFFGGFAGLGTRTF